MAEKTAAKKGQIIHVSGYDKYVPPKYDTGDKSKKKGR